MPNQSPTLINYKVSFPSGELFCPECTKTVSGALKRIEGVNPQSVAVSYIFNSAELELDPAKCSTQKIIDTIEAVGYSATSCTPKSANDTPFPDKPINPTPLFWKALIPAVFGLSLMVLEMLGLMPMTLIALSLFAAAAGVIMLYSGWDIYKHALKSAQRFSIGMSSLVTLASVIAFVCSILLILVHANILILPLIAGLHLSLCAGILVLAVVNLGLYLKERAKAEATKDLPKLRNEYLKLQPRTVCKIIGQDINGNELTEQIDTKDIKRGDRIKVEAGQAFIDGTIISHEPLRTARSIPCYKIPVDMRSENGETSDAELTTGHKVCSGTIFKNRISEGYSAVAVIEASVDGRGNFHNRMERIAKGMDGNSNNSVIDRASKYFTFIVIAIAIGAFLGWFLIGNSLPIAITVFLSVLLCACPCALGLVEPLTYSSVAAITQRKGIVISKASALYDLTKIKAVAFDMTGTLTSGDMELTHFSEGIDNNLLQKIASLEFAQRRATTHPIAEAIIKKNQLPLLIPSEAKTDASQGGMSGKFGEDKVHIGGLRWMRTLNIHVPAELIEQAEAWSKTSLATENRIVVTSFVAVNNEIRGVLGASQSLREGATETIAALKKRNIETILLTGGLLKTAETIAQHLKIDRVVADQNPQSKKDYAEARNIPMAMVGDEGNDSDVLNANNVVGIAVSSKTPAAAAAAISLSGDSLKELLSLMQIAKTVKRNIRLNLALSFFYNLTSIALAAGVLFSIGFMLNPILASVIMGAASLSAIIIARGIGFFIERQLNPELSFLSYINPMPQIRKIAQLIARPFVWLLGPLLSYWKKASTANKLIQVAFSMSSLLLVSTISANLILGFSWPVILNSMILICTCCTGVVGILSAVALIGVLSLGITLAVMRYVQSAKAKKDDHEPAESLAVSTVASISAAPVATTKMGSGNTSNSIHFFYEPPLDKLKVVSSLPEWSLPALTAAPSNFYL